MTSPALYLESNMFHDYNWWYPVLGIVLLALVVWWASQPGNPVSAKNAGAQYALAELFNSDNLSATLKRLEYESSSLEDPTPFDEGIREVLRRRSDLRSQTLIEVMERLQAGYDAGEASTAEVGYASDTVKRLMDGHVDGEDDPVFVVEYLVRRDDGSVLLVRKPNSELPRWAEYLRG